MLEEGASPNQADIKGFNAFHWAIKTTQRGVLKSLIEEGGGDMDQRDNEFWTPLHYAVFWRDVEMTKMMVTAGADVNLKTRGVYGTMTPLHMAVLWGNVEIVRVLLAHKAIIDLVDDQGSTALMLSCMYPNVDLPIFLELLEAGASIYLINHHGKRTIDYAREKIAPGPKKDFVVKTLKAAESKL